MNRPHPNPLPPAGEGTNVKNFSIHDLMSARYEEGARGPDAYDCFGLFAELCRRSGFEIPDHPSPADREQIEEKIMAAAIADWQILREPEIGCAVAIRIGPWVSHIGMVIEGNRFIHANEKTGVTVARLDDVMWVKRIVGFYRYARERNV